MEPHSLGSHQKYWAHTEDALGSHYTSTGLTLHEHWAHTTMHWAHTTMHWTHTTIHWAHTTGALGSHYRKPSAESLGSEDLDLKMQKPGMKMI